MGEGLNWWCSYMRGCHLVYIDVYMDVVILIL